jgi:hypothetical protein
MNTQKTMPPIPKAALIGLYDPAEEDESAPASVLKPSKIMKRQEVVAQISCFITQPVVSYPSLPASEMSSCDCFEH